ncbi:patatin-like phospholipase family protein [Flavobacteriaceae bacterium F89]|uniref:Patatin-like phospholipase family protein n=1 Tax=Cerina litoralis TaxID=2874477 RepID=A0AAE3JRZ8_9FLAO|nr:patatin-like phospholipase family protein [Cerina litoralis]MCG2460127.1 patatin-like phospholipase family protein [Cerina litoralis]
MPIKIVLIFALFSFCFLSAQQQPGKDSLKVGLVLSGGGAKGLAHIGALKVIEKAGIKLDYIGGTSMGAIVGALYAAGYSAEELDSIFRKTNFVNLIQDNLPREAKSFYEKDDADRYALTLPFDKFKLSFPPAYSGGQNIYNELVRLLYPVRDVRNFRKLPIPFICMATDVETGDQVLLDKGYLPEALLASGALPSLFEPTEIDGKLLVDGGVMNNYPVDEVRQMGANFIIGVDVQHGLSDRESLLSATEILLQISNYRTARDMEKKANETDIYIKPDISTYSVIDFSSGATLIASGEKATEAKYPELRELALRQNAPKLPNRHLKVADSLVVNNLLLSGTSNYTRGYIKGKLRFELGDKISFKKLELGISNLAATGNFKTIKYELVTSEEGEDLILKLTENPNKTFLRMAVHYDDLYKTAALINLTKKNLLMKDDVGSFDFIIGDNVRYDLEYYVDKGFYWSFGLNSRLNAFNKEVDYNLLRTNFGLIEDPSIGEINLSVTDITSQVYIQTVLREEFAFILGVEEKYLKYSTKTLGTPSGQVPLITNNPNRTTFEKSNYFSTYGKLILDTYDDKYFPTQGLYFSGDFHLYLLSSDYNNNFKEFAVGKARMGAAFHVFDKFSLNLETEGGFKLGTSEVSALDFALGGYGAAMINNFIPFFGYDFLGLPGNSFVKAYGRLDYNFAPKNHLMFAANYANVEDDIFRTGEWFTPPNFSGYGLGYGWESFFGPVQVFYSWSPERAQSDVFFSIGYWF